MISLDDLERDALTEFVNIGVGRAAVSLRKMVGQQIALSVPAIELVRGAEVAKLIGKSETGARRHGGTDYFRPVSGRGLLIFQEASGRALTRILANNALSDEELSDF